MASPQAVDDHHRRLLAVLGEAAVLTPLGDRPWGHRSFSVRSPGGAEVAVYAERPSGDRSQ
ncbi:MAG TPA: hypothetical protein VF486_16780 [Actinomycetes bacterium]